MHPNNCFYLKKGLWNFNLFSFFEKEREIYQISDFNNSDVDKIKVFYEPDFSSKIYNKKICEDHEKWKSELIESKWFKKSNTENTDIVEEKKEIDKTFGFIYNIIDGNSTVLKFSAGNVYSHKTVKDKDFVNNNVLWVKISKEYDTWMPFI